MNYLNYGVWIRPKLWSMDTLILWMNRVWECTWWPKLAIYVRNIVRCDMQDFADPATVPFSITSLLQSSHIFFLLFFLVFKKKRCEDWRRDVMENAKMAPLLGQQSLANVTCWTFLCVFGGWRLFLFHI